MDKIFFIGIIIGILSRLIMLHLDQKQYPTEPNILLSQLVLAFVASALGSLLVPALIERPYTSITFLSLAAQQFRQVRDNRRDTLQNLEDMQLIQRGNAFIEEIARTYEVRNYTCIITSFLTVGIYYIISSEFKLGDTLSIIISSICGLALAFILKKLLTRQSIGDIADVVPSKISFVDECIMQVGELKGITNIGLEKDREKYLSQGLGIEIIPKDNSYGNAGTIYDPGQRQAIIYNIYSRIGILREEDEPAFYPLPRINLNNGSLVIAVVPVDKDINKLIDAVKSCPILSSAKGKNVSLKNYQIDKKGSV